MISFIVILLSLFLSNIGAEDLIIDPVSSTQLSEANLSEQLPVKSASPLLPLNLFPPKPSVEPTALPTSEDLPPEIVTLPKKPPTLNNEMTLTNERKSEVDVSGALKDDLPYFGLRRLNHQQKDDIINSTLSSDLSLNNSADIIFNITGVPTGMPTVLSSLSIDEIGFLINTPETPTGEPTFMPSKQVKDPKPKKFKDPKGKLPKRDVFKTPFPSLTPSVSPSSPTSRPNLAPTTTPTKKPTIVKGKQTEKPTKGIKSKSLKVRRYVGEEYPAETGI